jgi:hypothetical protein
VLTKALGPVRTYMHTSRIRLDIHLFPVLFGLCFLVLPCCAVPAAAIVPSVTFFAAGATAPTLPELRPTMPELALPCFCVFPLGMRENTGCQGPGTEVCREGCQKRQSAEAWSLVGPHVRPAELLIFSVDVLVWTVLNDRRCALGAWSLVGPLDLAGHVASWHRLTVWNQRFHC